MSDCIFCRILTGQVEASFVHRDEVCAAFMDIQPVNPGHVLVVPVEHHARVEDVPLAVWQRMNEVAQELVRALPAAGVPCDGVNLFLANGESAGQEVFHAHLHVFPRFKGDGFGLRFPEGYRDLPPRAELDRIAEAVRTSRQRDQTR